MNVLQPYLTNYQASVIQKLGELKLFSDGKTVFAKLLTPEVVKEVFQQMDLELKHVQSGTGNEGESVHSVQAVLSYRGEILLRSNSIQMKVQS